MIREHRSITTKSTWYPSPSAKTTWFGITWPCIHRASSGKKDHPSLHIHILLSCVQSTRQEKPSGICQYRMRSRELSVTKNKDMDCCPTGEINETKSSAFIQVMSTNEAVTETGLTSPSCEFQPRRPLQCPEQRRKSRAILDPEDSSIPQS